MRLYLPQILSAVKETRTLTDYFLIFLKGMGMGAANVIPGVSGGTIAFITGIYDDLIHSLKSFDLTAIRLLMAFKIKAFSDHINLPFLVALMGGVFISLITVGKGLKYLFFPNSLGLLFAIRRLCTLHKPRVFSWWRRFASII